MKKKRILVKKGETLILHLMGFLGVWFLFESRPEGMSVIRWFADPLGVIGVTLMLLITAVTSIYYEVTDEYIRLCHFVFRTSKIMIESIVSVGIVSPYDEEKETYVTYLKYINDNNEEKYFFLMPSYKLYEYISENFSLNYVEDDIDRKSRNRMNERDRRVKRKINLICVLFLVPIFVCAIIMLWYTFIRHLLMNSYMKAFIVLLFSFVPYAEMVMFLGYCFIEYEKVSFDENGVYVKFPLHRLMKFSWDDFQQICIIYDMTTGNRGVNNTRDILICFVRHGVKKELISGGWPINSGRKYKKIFRIQYSEDIMNELEKCCPYNIVDLRGSGSYTH